VWRTTSRCAACAVAVCQQQASPAKHKIITTLLTRLQSICHGISQVKVSEFNQLKAQLGAIARKQTGSLAVSLFSASRGVGC
jgi:hypothetical protein